MKNKEIDYGGSAFPLPCNEAADGQRYQTNYEGMTLRDYFAAKAMQAMLSNHHMYDHINDNCSNILAIDAFMVADAMIKTCNQQ